MKNFLLARSCLLLLLIGFLLQSCTNSNQESKHQLYTVEIKQMKFNPAEITVHKGDTIVFENKDLVAHDVTEEKDKAWTSGSLAPNASWKMVADKNSDYFCSIHVVMKGKIRIEQ
ncbi:MAG: plastocyanin/azurin family copper-binding protein [Ilyomonas sp.]